MVVFWWFIFLMDMLIPRFVTDEIYLDEDEYFDLIFRWAVVLDKYRQENNCEIKSFNFFGIGFFPTFYDIVYENTSE